MSFLRFNTAPMTEKRRLQQQGMSATAMLWVLLFFSLLVLSGSAAILMSIRKETANELYFYRHYHLAASSLSWGLMREWPEPHNTWQCQVQPPLSVCFKHSSHKGLMLVRGVHGSIAVYALGQYQAETQHIHVKKGQWLDFCPEKNESDCD